MINYEIINYNEIKHSALVLDPGTLGLFPGILSLVLTSLPTSKQIH